MALSGPSMVVSLTRPDGRIPIVLQVLISVAEWQGRAGSNRIIGNRTFGGNYHLVRKGHSLGSQIFEEFFHEFHSCIGAVF
jgi:hypothetical protein